MKIRKNLFLEKKVIHSWHSQKNPYKKGTILSSGNIM